MVTYLAKSISLWKLDIDLSYLMDTYGDEISMQHKLKFSNTIVLANVFLSIALVLGLINPAASAVKDRHLYATIFMCVLFLLSIYILYIKTFLSMADNPIGLLRFAPGVRQDYLLITYASVYILAGYYTVSYLKRY